MSQTVDHVCIADHCVACCPSARAYSDGYETAKSFYSMHGDIETDLAVRVAVLIILLAVLVGLTFWVVKRHHDSAQ